MKRERRAELVALGKFHASVILTTALEGWDPNFDDVTEAEMLVIEAEIRRIAGDLMKRARPA